jgi:hypothetical protein
VLPHARQDGLSYRLLVPGWRMEPILLTEQLTFVLKKMGFGDDRFLPSLPPNSPPA